SQGMNQKIAMYTQKSLRQNLIDYFTALSKSQNTKTIRLPVSKKQLSDYFGVQRPSLFRELKRMKEDGLVSINNRSITIHF
ncbi:MAG: helix-turn-helix domain-containing protein, partial [Tissierellia bacterium]|nr:helix-turn-helix domain-containing protein [Tissierellia bacterium]